MSNDYHIAVSAIVDACKGVSALGRKEDPSSSFDTFDTQFCFVEKYSARAFKISVEPCSWLSFSDNDIGVSVSIAFDSALWSSISDRDYADFGAKKKDNRRKNVVGENPDYGIAFDKWWEVVSNICQNDRDARCKILSAIGYMIALSRTSRCNYKKGSQVSRTTIGKIARASSLHVSGASSLCVSDIEHTIETYLTKCCGAFVVECGEREDAPMPSPRKPSRPKAEIWRTPPRPVPRPTPTPRYEPPRKQWEAPPPKPQPKQRREWRPPPPPRHIETKSFWRRHPLLPVGIAAVSVFGVIFLVQDNNFDFVKEKIEAGVESVREGMRSESEGNSSENVSDCATPQSSVPSTYNAPVARTQVAEWPKPKDWFYNECNVIERNVQFYTGGGYRFDKGFARKIASCISALRSNLSRDDIGGSVRAYNELKQAYLSFENGCQWQPNVRHPKYNHVLSSYTKNQWMAESGWEFVNPGTSDFSVRRKPVQVRCNSCRGSGYVMQKSQCYSCNGRGRIPNPAAQVGQAVNAVGGLINAFGGNRRGRHMPRVPQGPSEIRCPSCNGTGGQQMKVRCGRCNGAGSFYQ